jgi:lactoylglutathione lyase
MLSKMITIIPIILFTKYCTVSGVRFTPGGVRKGASGHDVTFIHPKGNDEYPISGAGV